MAFCRYSLDLLIYIFPYEQGIILKNKGTKSGKLKKKFVLKQKFFFFTGPYSVPWDLSNGIWLNPLPRYFKLTLFNLTLTLTRFIPIRKWEGVKGVSVSVRVKSVSLKYWSRGGRAIYRWIDLTELSKDPLRKKIFASTHIFFTLNLTLTLTLTPFTPSRSSHKNTVEYAKFQKFEKIFALTPNLASNLSKKIMNNWFIDLLFWRKIFWIIKMNKNFSEFCHYFLFEIQVDWLIIKLYWISKNKPLSRNSYLQA